MPTDARVRVTAQGGGTAARFWPLRGTTGHAVGRAAGRVDRDRLLPTSRRPPTRPRCLDLLAHGRGDLHPMGGRSTVMAHHLVPIADHSGSFTSVRFPRRLSAIPARTTTNSRQPLDRSSTTPVADRHLAPSPLGRSRVMVSELLRSSEGSEITICRIDGGLTPTAPLPWAVARTSHLAADPDPDVARPAEFDTGQGRRVGIRALHNPWPGG